MKIKEEFKGKILTKYDPILGQIKIEVDKIKPEMMARVKQLGFDIFEDLVEIVKDAVVDHLKEKVEERKTRRRKKDA
jgi:hypothetical protein